MTYLLEKVFDLPMYWGAAFIEKHLREEVDFVNEARNSEIATKHISEVPELAGRVTIPKVHWDLTTSRVMTAEWIDGIPLYDEIAIKKQGYSLSDIMTIVVDIFSDVSRLCLDTIAILMCFNNSKYSERALFIVIHIVSLFKWRVAQDRVLTFEN
jgi:hypothetical protein